MQSSPFSDPENKITALRSLILLGFLFLGGFGSFAQDLQDYDEFSVELRIPKLGTIEMPVAIKEQDAYISVRDLFDQLRIKNEVEEDSPLIRGYFLSPDAAFIIDPEGSQITFKGEVFPIPEGDIIQSPTSLYLKTPYFGEIFGLHTDFNFRSLAIDLRTEIDESLKKDFQHLSN